MLLTISRERGKTLQAQIVEQFQEQIRRGELPAGSRLPSSRHLAETLGVSRNTIIHVYERLASEGFVEIVAASHVRVSDQARNRLPRSNLRSHQQRGRSKQRKLQFSGRQHIVRRPTRKLAADFWMQRADPRAFPLRMWRRLIVERLGQAGENLIDYGDPIGLASLREAITDYVLPDRGIITRPENVFIFAGAQLALNLVARLMVRPKGAIVIENPANQGASYLFESYQGKLIPLPVDENGLVVSALRNMRADFAYVTPSHQFPLGATLSLERRHQLIEWAERVNSYIVEDDYDSQFFYDGPPLPALKALNDDRVVYIGTFSKLLGAGLRIGFAVFPDELVDEAKTAKALLDNGPPWLEQATLQAFITRGSYARHVRTVRQQYLRQRNCLIAGLHQFFGTPTLIGASSGTHVCWQLPPDLPNALKVQQLALSKRVAVYTIQDGGGEEYAPRRYTPRVLMLGYAALSEAEIRRGIVRLADALNH